MVDRSAPHGAPHGTDAMVDLSVDSDQSLVATALDREVEAFIADLEADYQLLSNPQFQVSFNTNHNHHSLDTQAGIDNQDARHTQAGTIGIDDQDARHTQAGIIGIDDQDARHTQANIHQDITRLNLEGGGHNSETYQHNPEDQPMEQARPTLLHLVRSTLESLIGRPVSEPHQHPNEDQEEEDAESDPTLHTINGTILDCMPVVNLHDLEDDSKDCPICQEPYPDSDSYDADTPVMLHCSHILGRACLETWMLGPKNTCPLCRSPILVFSTPQADQEQSVEEARGLEAMTAEEEEAEGLRLIRELEELNERIRSFSDRPAEEITRAEVAALNRDFSEHIVRYRAVNGRGLF